MRDQSDGDYLIVMTGGPKGRAAAPRADRRRQLGVSRRRGREGALKANAFATGRIVDMSWT